MCIQFRTFWNFRVIFLTHGLFWDFCLSKWDFKVIFLTDFCFNIVSRNFLCRISVFGPNMQSVLAILCTLENWVKCSLSMYVCVYELDRVGCIVQIFLTLSDFFLLLLINEQFIKIVCHDVDLSIFSFDSVNFCSLHIRLWGAIKFRMVFSWDVALLSLLNGPVSLALLLALTFTLSSFHIAT